VFQSGNILLRQASNSNYCVSFSQLGRNKQHLVDIFQPCPLLSGQQPAGQKLAAPGGYLYYQVYSGFVLQFLD
jgi:hypothetical protein